MIDIEAQRKMFNHHVATLTDHGNIKVLDFKNPESNVYRIRFIFEEDYCRCHISGDLGEAIASNDYNMTFEGFKDFVHSSDYFEKKLDCSSRDIYIYNEELAEKSLRERLNVLVDDDEDVDDIVYEMMSDFRDNGFGSKAYDILRQYDDDCWEYIQDLGKEPTGILDLYLLAFELATEQLKKKKEGK